MTSSITLDPHALLNRAMEMHYAEIAAVIDRRGYGTAAGDIVHDLYLKLADRPELLEGKRSLKAFLCRAALNLGLDRARRARFEARLFSGTEAEAERVQVEGAAPGSARVAAERLVALRAAILELPPRQRTVFVLHRLYQLEPDRIAAHLKISRNMVDRHLRHALAYCLDCLSALD